MSQEIKYKSDSAGVVTVPTGEPVFRFGAPDSPQEVLRELNALHARAEKAEAAAAELRDDKARLIAALERIRDAKFNITPENFAATIERGYAVIRGVAQAAIDATANSSEIPNGSLKIPAEWEKITGITVLDPDGWDRKTDWSSVAISSEEFERRCALSTCSARVASSGSLAHLDARYDGVACANTRCQFHKPCQETQNCDAESGGESAVTSCKDYKPAAHPVSGDKAEGGVL